MPYSSAHLAIGHCMTIIGTSKRVTVGENTDMWMA